MLTHLCLQPWNWQIVANLLSPTDAKLFLLLPSINTKPAKVFNISAIQLAVGDRKQNLLLLFFHTITGCDITSALYGQGKKCIFRLLSKKSAFRRPFWMTKNHFRSYFSPFQINTQLFFRIFFKMAAGRHFGSPFWAILDDRKSLSIAFIAISDQYATFFFEFFSKWPPAAILEVQFAPKIIGFFHYVLSMAMPNMKLIGEFVTQLEMPQAFWAFLYKMVPEAILFFRLMTKIIGFL